MKKIDEKTIAAINSGCDYQLIVVRTAIKEEGKGKGVVKVLKPIASLERKEGERFEKGIDQNLIKVMKNLENLMLEDQMMLTDLTDYIRLGDKSIFIHLTGVYYDLDQDLNIKKISFVYQHKIKASIPQLDL